MNLTLSHKQKPKDATGPDKHPVWLRPGGFALLLGAMTLATFPQALLQNDVFFVHDFGLFSYPVAWYQRDCFWRGELPFWNPYNFCGVPFLAQWNTMCLYPPTLIYLLLPFPWSLNFFSLLHLWFAGLGMYFLAHRWTAHRLAASVAGVVFAFNGLSLNLLMWPSHIATFSWMPWVILAVERAWTDGSRKVLVAALAAALQLLAGGPETILFTWLLVLALWALSFVRVPYSKDAAVSQRARMASRLVVVGVLALALAGAQLLPFLDFAAHSQRELGFADTLGSMPGSGWANFLVPMAFGKIYPENVFVQTGQDWTSSYYLGTGALLLAGLALWSVRDQRVWLLLGASALAFLCALGDHTFFYPFLQRLIPQLTLMTYPVKFVIVIAFAVPILAAFGIAWAQNASREMPALIARKQVVLGGLLLGLIGIILVWARSNTAAGDDFSLALHSGLSRAAFLGATVLTLLLLRRVGLTARRSLVSFVLLALPWLDVLTHEPPQNPTISSSVFTAGQARLELALQPSPALGQSRVMVSKPAKKNLNYLHVKDVETEQIARRLGFFCNCNLLDAVPKVDGFFSLKLDRFDAMLTFLYYLSNADFPRLEDFLSVSHITAPDSLTDWVTRTNWLAMVTAGQKPIFLDSAATAQRLIQPDFDGSKVVFLLPEAQPVVTTTHQTDASISSLQFDRQRVDFVLTAAEPSLAVLSQSYYHWWRAYVDDQRAPLFPANYAFQAVPVPAGVHRVRLVYQDRTFQSGVIISFVALLTCGIAWRRCG